MEILNVSIINDLLQQVSSFAVPFAITFAAAEFILHWFLRLAFGNHKSINID